MKVTAGAICRVVHQPHNAHVLCTALRRCCCEGGNSWQCELLTSAVVDIGFASFRMAAGNLSCFPESDLRPLHDGDGVDEMIEIAGKPNEAVEEAWREIAEQIG